MVQTIQENKRFKDDFERYKSALDKLPEGPEKAEFKKLFDTFVFEVKKLDNMYLDMVYSNQLNSFGAEIRDRITSYRKDLDRKCSNLSI